MPPQVMAILGGQLLGIGAAAFGEWWGSADEDQKLKLQEQAQQIYAGMSPPEVQRLTAQEMGPSAFQGLPTDYGNRDARNQALQGIMSMGLSGGMDAGSQLALEQARRASAEQVQQQQGAVRQQFAARGLGGAGEAAAQLAAQQGGAQRASLGGLQATSDARSRALQALMQGGGLAQQAETADYGQAANRAAAQDAFSRFNAEQRAATGQFNAGLQQQGWQNQLGLADRQYAATQARAGEYETEAERKRRIAGGIGQSFQAAGNTLAGGVPGGGK